MESFFSIFLMIWFKWLRYLKKYYFPVWKQSHCVCDIVSHCVCDMDSHCVCDMDSHCVCDMDSHCVCDMVSHCVCDIVSHSVIISWWLIYRTDNYQLKPWSLTGTMQQILLLILCIGMKLNVLMQTLVLEVIFSVHCIWVPTTGGWLSNIRINISLKQLQLVHKTLVIEAKFMWSYNTYVQHICIYYVSPIIQAVLVVKCLEHI